MRGFRCLHGQLRSETFSCHAVFNTLLNLTGPSQDAMSNTVFEGFLGSSGSILSTSSSLDVVEEGDGGGGVAGSGDGALARLGTGRCAPGGGAGRATQGLGPSQARYKDNIPRRGEVYTDARHVAAFVYIGSGKLSGKVF